ncbi:MAG: hypothetical protein WC059_01295 [Candidatus Paceibacterota bacterium]
MSQKGIYLSSWAKITILATLIVFCFVFGFYAGTRSEQDNLIKNKVVEVSKPTEAGKFIEWKEYKNDELGISFNYPAEFGEISIQKSEDGTQFRMNSSNPSGFSDPYFGALTIEGATKNFKMPICNDDIFCDYNELDLLRFEHIKGFKFSNTKDMAWKGVASHTFLKLSNGGILNILPSIIYDKKLDQNIFHSTFIAQFNLARSYSGLWIQRNYNGGDKISTEDFIKFINSVKIY